MAIHFYLGCNYALLKLSIILVICDDASYMFVLCNTIPTDNKTAWVVYSRHAVLQYRHTVRLGSGAYSQKGNEMYA